MDALVLNRIADLERRVKALETMWDPRTLTVEAAAPAPAVWVAASPFARGVAALAWTEPETAHIVMEPALAEAFARTLQRYIDALQWCSGSADFGHGGQAHEGWRRVCAELLPPCP